MIAQPLICVTCVETSSRWYQQALGLVSGHGGSDYERLLSDDRLILQLHRWCPDEHPELGHKPTVSAAGVAMPGVALWFQTDQFNATVERLSTLGLATGSDVRHNANAKHREVWLADPDGFVVVIASAYGDL